MYMSLDKVDMVVSAAGRDFESVGLGPTRPIHHQPANQLTNQPTKLSEGQNPARLRHPP